MHCLLLAAEEQGSREGREEQKMKFQCFLSPLIHPGLNMVWGEGVGGRA